MVSWLFSRKHNKSCELFSERYEVYLRRQEITKKALTEVNTVIPFKESKEFLSSFNTGEVLKPMSYADMIRRGVKIKDIKENKNPKLKRIINDKYSLLFLYNFFNFSISVFSYT